MRTNALLALTAAAEADPKSARVLVGRMRRLQVTGRSRDIKGAVALLSSEASDWLTGQNLVVDGGWSIW